MIEMNEKTKLKDILAVYPWLEEEAIKMDERFSIIHSPIGKLLLKKATIGDLAKKAEKTPEEVIAEIRKHITKHEK